MYNIAVMGDADSVRGFSVLGIGTFPVSDLDSARKTLAKLVKGDYAIVYVTEEYAAGLQPEINELRDMVLPAVIPIPGISGNNGCGMHNVKRAVERAVGSDIIFND